LFAFLFKKGYFGNLHIEEVAGDRAGAHRKYDIEYDTATSKNA